MAPTTSGTRLASQNAHEAPIENPSVPMGTSGVAGMARRVRALERTRSSMASMSASCSRLWASAASSVVTPP